MGEPPDGGFSSRLERVEDRLRTRMEDRVEDRVEVYEAQLAENHYYGLAPTPYDYQVQSKSPARARLEPACSHCLYLPAYNSLQRRPPASPGNSRLGLPLCDNINLNRNSLRTPLLEDDRESCV